MSLIIKIKSNIIIIIIIIVIKKEISKREINKTQERQVMHNQLLTTPLTDAQPVPEQQSSPLSQRLPVYTLSMTSCGMEYPFG